MKKEEIMEMLESKKDEMVSISLKDDGVHLRGTDIGINSCQAMLESTIDDRKIYRTTFTASSEAVINQLSNPATKQRLQEIGKKTRCVINVKSHCKIIMKNGNIAEEDVSHLFLFLFFSRYDFYYTSVFKDILTSTKLF